MRYAAILLLLSGCAMQKIEGGEPDTTIQFAAPRVPGEVSDCVKSRATIEIMGRGLQDGHQADKAFVAEPLYGWLGPQGYIWIVNVYPERAEIQWMTKMVDGQRDDMLEQIVRECASSTTG
jgi:hypothetical protein